MLKVGIVAILVFSEMLAALILNIFVIYFFEIDQLKSIISNRNILVITVMAILIAFFLSSYYLYKKNFLLLKDKPECSSEESSEEGCPSSKNTVFEETSSQLSIFDFNIASSPYPIVIFDNNQSIIATNQKSLEMLNVEEADVVGENFFLKFTNLLQNQTSKVDADKTVLRDNYITSNMFIIAGAEKFCDWILLPVNKGSSSENVTLCIGADRTEAVNLKKEVSEKEQIIGTLVEKVRHIYYRADSKGIILDISHYVNALSESLTPDDFVGRNATDFYVNPQQREELLKKLSCDGYISDFDVELELPNGERQFVSISASRFYDNDGRYCGVEGFLQNITARKESEKYLEEYSKKLEHMVNNQLKELIDAKEKAEEANRAKSSFLASITHEIRTPLHGILSFSELGVAKAEIIDADKAGKYFSTINSSGKRLLRLLNDLLDFAKMEAGKMEYSFNKIELYSLATIVIDEFQGMITEKRMELICEQPDFSTVVLGDGTRVSQVIANLISNAIKYSDTDSKIEIIFSNAEICGINEEKSVPAIQFDVIDNGIGMEKSEIESVFEKFMQANSGKKRHIGGTGLGLAISREIVNAHCGEIFAANNPEGGAIFTVKLPHVPQIY